MRTMLWTLLIVVSVMLQVASTGRIPESSEESSEEDFDDSRMARAPMCKVTDDFEDHYLYIMSKGPYYYFEPVNGKRRDKCKVTREWFQKRWHMEGLMRSGNTEPTTKAPCTCKQQPAPLDIRRVARGRRIALPSPEARDSERDEPVKKPAMKKTRRTMNESTTKNTLDESEQKSPPQNETVPSGSNKTEVEDGEISVRMQAEEQPKGKSNEAVEELLTFRIIPLPAAEPEATSESTTITTPGVYVPPVLDVDLPPATNTEDEAGASKPQLRASETISETSNAIDEPDNAPAASETHPEEISPAADSLKQEGESKPLTARRSEGGSATEEDTQDVSPSQPALSVQIDLKNHLQSADKNSLTVSFIDNNKPTISDDLAAGDSKGGKDPEFEIVLRFYNRNNKNYNDIKTKD